MQRVVIIRPGSHSLWPLSVPSLILFDQVKVSSADIQAVFREGSHSSLHHLAAETLENLLKDQPASFIVRDRKLRRGRESLELRASARRLAHELLGEADKYSFLKPTLIKPSELKHALVTAYEEYLRYYKSHLPALNRTEAFSNWISREQVPVTIENLNKIRSTHSRNIVEFVTAEPHFLRVLEELVLDSILILELIEHGNVYDPLIAQYLPLLDCIERLRFSRSLRSSSSAPIDTSMFWRLFEYRMRRISSGWSRPTVDVGDAIMLAFERREQFRVLRQRLVELDILLNAKEFRSQELREFFSLVRTINKQTQSLDNKIPWFFWTAVQTSTFLFQEYAPALSFAVQNALKAVVGNPSTVKYVKETIQNFRIALKGISPYATGHLVAVRDAAILRKRSRSGQVYSQTPLGLFRSWK